MPKLLAAAATALIAFVATNIDDIIVLTLFFSAVNKRFRRWHVVVGQYAGFAALVALSLAGYFARFVVPEQLLGLLGILPIIIGLKKLWELKRGKPEEAHIEKPAAHAVFTVATVTFANGGDNIGIYTPLFANSSFVELVLALSVFFMLVGLWCALGYFLGRHPYVSSLLDRYGHTIMPFVLIALGLYIMLGSATFSLL
jgi:cadmium resistance transport/sequestration family protein